MYTNVELSIGIKADISSKVQIAENLGIKAIQHWKFLYEAYPLRRKLKLSQGKSKVTLKVYKSFYFFENWHMDMHFQAVFRQKIFILEFSCGIQIQLESG